jgi:CRP-like cAMP-binding protein
MLHKQDKETKALADELAALPVFGSLDRKAVEALASSGRVVHLPTQWALITESQPADSCYVLLSGETEVRQHGDVVANLTAGALVGEAALVEHKTRNATVITTSEVRALRLGFDDLSTLFAQHPAVEQVFRAEWDKRSAGV